LPFDTLINIFAEKSIWVLVVKKLFNKVFFMAKQDIEQKKDSNDSPKPSRFLVFWTGIGFMLPLIVIYLYSVSPKTYTIGSFELKKLALSREEIIDEVTELKHDYQQVNFGNLPNVYPVIFTKSETDSVSFSDTMKLMNSFRRDSFVVVHEPAVHYSDSAKHRVMIMGDSECGGLCFQLNKYCQENNHELVFSLIWNSATILNFGNSDTVTKLIDKYNPTYLFFVVGLNELHANDLNKRKIAANKLLNKIKGIPYTWIGPANYMDDRGINNIFQSIADSGSFFLTKGMNLPKGNDGRHPSTSGYQLWMDSIANWMSSKARHKIAMAKPRNKKYPFRSKMLVLNATKFRGY